MNTIFETYAKHTCLTRQFSIFSKSPPIGGPFQTPDYSHLPPPLFIWHSRSRVHDLTRQGLSRAPASSKASLLICQETPTFQICKFKNGDSSREAHRKPIHISLRADRVCTQAYTYCSLFEKKMLFYIKILMNFLKPLRDIKL